MGCKQPAGQPQAMVLAVRVAAERLPEHGLLEAVSLHGKPQLRLVGRQRHVVPGRDEMRKDASERESAAVAAAAPGAAACCVLRGPPRQA